MPASPFRIRHHWAPIPAAPPQPLLIADLARVAADMPLQAAPTEVSSPIAFLPRGSVVRLLSSIARPPYPGTPASLLGWALVEPITAAGAGPRGFLPIHLLASVTDPRYPGAQQVIAR